MFRSTTVLLILCLAALDAHAADLLIENVTIVSADLPQPRAAQSVLIHDGRIVRVGSKLAANGAQRLDGRGKFLAPGLMDSHVHVTSTPGLPENSQDPADLALVAAYEKQQPRSYLYFGVTQLLDPANNPAGIERFEAQPQHPDLFRCGAAPVLDGYPTLFIDKAIRYDVAPGYIFEPANAANHPLPPGADAAAHTPEVIVNRIAASGAHCVKIFIEDGFGGRSDWPLPSHETLQRVRAAATQRGLLLVAHANALAMQRLALEAKVDVIAHGLWNWDQANGQADVPPQIAAHLKQVAASRTGWQPTLRVLPGTADLFRADTLLDPTYRKVVPAAVLAWYGTEPGQWFKRTMREEYGGLPDDKILSLEIKTANQGVRATGYLYHLGHPLLLGSDTPSAPTYGNQPGYDTYREMRLMALAGVSPPDILRAATINNARQFHLERAYGTVGVGKVANLLLLDANPLESVRAWNEIDKVILHGVVIERESLAADASR